MDSSQKKPRICLFGGTFDPIHLGHIHVAQQAQETLQLDKIIFLPCKQSPHKTGQQHAAAEHRLQMCKLATDQYDWAEVSDFDLTAPAPSYSWKTAEAMTAKYPDAELFWLMGSDQWAVIDKWDRPHHLASLVNFIVFKRGVATHTANDYKAHIIDGDHPASSTAIRKSTDSLLLKSWLNPEVADYTATQQLYHY